MVLCRSKSSVTREGVTHESSKPADRADFRSAVLVVLSLTIALPFVTCQNLVGGLTGTVADPSGAVVSGVQVKILSPNTGFQRVTVTRHDGTFQIADLPIGTYQVTLSPSRQPRRDPARLGEPGV